MLNIQKNISLSQYTTFKIGGPAKFFIEVRDIEELKKALKYAKSNRLNFFILGGGSNVLVNDKGFDGLVIRVKFNKVEIDINIIQAEAGATLAEILKKSTDSGLTGLEWAAGIPGTLGGAIRGNAGAFNGEMEAIIDEIVCLNTEDSEEIILKKEDCVFSYRNSLLKKNANFIIISAKLKLENGNVAKIQEKIQQNIMLRIKKQPKAVSSAGSFFVNPTVDNLKLIEDFEKESGLKSKENRIPAGWLIEKVGLKGKKVGDAMISDVQANFFVNTGQATAADLVMLISLAKQQVRDKFGVELQEEVQYLGF